MAHIRFGLIRETAGSVRFDAALAERDDAIIVTTNQGASIDARELIARNDLDAVILDCPRAHAPPLITAALASGKHVLTDHLAACSVEDMIDIRRAEANSNGPKVKFGVPHRYHGSIMEAKRISESGELGSLVSVRGLYGRAGEHSDRQSWRHDVRQSGGGVLMDLGLDMLDLMHFFAGPIEEVKSLVDNRVWRDRGVEDNVMALLRTNAGIMASFHASDTQWRQVFRLELGFQKGALWLDGVTSHCGGFSPEMLIVSQLEMDRTGRPVANPAEDIREFSDNKVDALELDEFISAIQTGTPLVNGTSQQAFDAVNVAQRIYAADHSFEPQAL